MIKRAEKDLMNVWTVQQAITASTQHLQQQPMLVLQAIIVHEAHPSNTLTNVQQAHTDHPQVEKVKLTVQSVVKANTVL